MIIQYINQMRTLLDLMEQNLPTQKKKSTARKEEYKDIVRKIGEKCFSKESKKTRFAIVHSTISYLANGEKHKAGDIESINRLPLAKNILKSLEMGKGCAQFKVLATTLLHQYGKMSSIK